MCKTWARERVYEHIYDYQSWDWIILGLCLFSLNVAKMWSEVGGSFQKWEVTDGSQGYRVRNCNKLRNRHTKLGSLAGCWDKKTLAFPAPICLEPTFMAMITHSCFFFFFKDFIYLFIYFSFIFISWRLITLQYCSGFCHTLTWISHGFTCIPQPDPPLPPPSLPNPSESGNRTVIWPSNTTHSCFWTVVLEKTLQSPLDCREIQPVHPKEDQSWVFFERTDVEAETSILWPPDEKSWLIWKDPDAGKDWG